ncbi:efflux RND transporter periplasmic adaptor subunit [Inhella gelatinilytica]|uniref:Biotin/lipoyl-binding protein n=1 Tax=Inhella gelatinilytica TaxID=2795030 RepID=A0A931NEG1_9BURK|nr:biotin/lipoyl-binding protein [Inhella gelatinilytica]MBH9554132.1 biotin/lipoyl-binding protein [Inhella gelatinilytica]
MTSPIPASPPSGAAMDRALPPRTRWQHPALRGAVIALALLGLAGLVVQQTLPSAPRVEHAQLVAAALGEFRDELPLRARVEPLRSVQLDAQEGGRVEAVLVQEGDTVIQGQPLLRLHSPEQEQMLMQRGAEVAQQLANVSLQRSAQTAAQAASRRELAQLQTAEQQAEAEWRRQGDLADAGFVAPAAREQAERTLRLAHRLREQAEHDHREDARQRQQSLDEMDRAVRGLRHGLQLLEQARERLLLRAPIGGRLSGFTPQRGASLQAGAHLGRIDDPAVGTQLVAEVDEFYLPRLQPQLPAHSPAGALRLAQTLPQVQGGRVRVLLHWDAGAEPQALRPGQAVDVRLQFSPPGPALLLPEGPGIQNRLFVRQGQQLLAREVRLGRRAAGQVEVLAGLQSGEQVLISQPPQGADTLRLP